MLDKNEDFFFNRRRSGLEELQSYQPSFYRRIREMVAINTFAGLTLDHMAQDMDNSFIYHFIDSGTLETLEEFERFLSIDVDSGSDIENRKTAVKMKWRGGGKMSRSRIRELVYEYCKSSCTVTMTDSQLIIGMKFTDDPSVYMPAIRQTISSSNIPAHVEVVYTGDLDCVYKMIWKIKTTVRSTEFRMWLSTYPGVQKLDGSSKLDGSLKLDAQRRWFEPDMELKINADTTKDMMDAECSVAARTNCFFRNGIPAKSTEHRTRFSTYQSMQNPEMDIKTCADTTKDMMDAECSVVTRTNYYKLDGSLKLDGTVKLNASEVEEVL